ncbi:hypothetical protein ACLB2K_065868 [Fragaria x ananassa]
MRPKHSYESRFIHILHYQNTISVHDFSHYISIKLTQNIILIFVYIFSKPKKETVEIYNQNFTRLVTSNRKFRSLGRQPDLLLLAADLQRLESSEATSLKPAKGDHSHQGPDEPASHLVLEILSRSNQKLSSMELDARDDPATSRSRHVVVDPTTSRSRCRRRRGQVQGFVIVLATLRLSRHRHHLSSGTEPSLSVLA